VAEPCPNKSGGHCCEAAFHRGKLRKRETGRDLPEFGKPGRVCEGGGELERSK